MVKKLEKRKEVRRVIYKRESRNISAIAFLSLLATIFSGYLSYRTVNQGSCPLAGECLTVLGLPSCVYGFFLFALIFILAFSSMISRAHFRSGIRALSILGILFTGFIGVYELFFATNNILNSTFTLILPSCVYGLIVFLAIYILD